ncbi:hypothetical protein NA56DRAFT_128624 [Hyaloscypha hepaticicola]|uniref:Uncharacterized protein n=1 Tax=Hyaloscypha hepaticicola TaxID=2082293 RepID=A0A2J6Q431_9HELO|nr:hypothetical protein NA56DRAFT_128624 [Hyaloscypha hepaticicola]
MASRRLWLQMLDPYLFSLQSISNDTDGPTCITRVRETLTFGRWRQIHAPSSASMGYYLRYCAHHCNQSSLRRKFERVFLTPIRTPTPPSLVFHTGGRRLVCKALPTPPLPYLHLSSACRPPVQSSHTARGPACRDEANEPFNLFFLSPF